MAKVVEVKNVLFTRTVLTNLAAGSLDLINLWAVMEGSISNEMFLKVFLTLRVVNVILTVIVRSATNKPARLGRALVTKEQGNA